MSRTANPNWKAWREYRTRIGFAGCGLNASAILLGVTLSEIYPTTVRDHAAWDAVIERADIRRQLGIDDRTLARAIDALTALKIIEWDGGQGKKSIKVRFRRSTLEAAVDGGYSLKPPPRLTVVK